MDEAKVAELNEKAEAKIAAKVKKPAVKAALKDDEVSRLKAELEAAKTKVAAGEEAAMQRVCKALGVDRESIKEPVKQIDENGRLIIRVNCHFPININGRVYRGLVEVSEDIAEVLMETIGKRRQRLLSEITGNNYQLKELAGGIQSPVVVGRVNDAGERIG